MAQHAYTVAKCYGLADWHIVSVQSSDPVPLCFRAPLGSVIFGPDGRRIHAAPAGTPKTLRQLYRRIEREKLDREEIQQRNAQ